MVVNESYPSNPMVTRSQSDAWQLAHTYNGCNTLTSCDHYLETSLLVSHRKVNREVNGECYQLPSRLPPHKHPPKIPLFAPHLHTLTPSPSLAVLAHALQTTHSPNQALPHLPCTFPATCAFSLALVHPCPLVSSRLKPNHTALPLPFLCPPSPSSSQPKFHCTHLPLPSHSHTKPPD